MFAFRFEDISYFQLRGLCENLYGLVDHEFVVDMAVSGQEGVVFTGLKKTEIVLEEDRWSLVNIEDGSVIMTLTTEVANTFIDQTKIIFS